LPLPIVERSEKEIARIIKSKVEGISDVKGCHQVAVRVTGKRLGVDLHLSIDTSLRFEEVHRIVSEVEREIRRLAPRARITIQTDPYGHRRDDVRTLVKKTAEAVPGSRGIHNIHIQKIDGKMGVDFHLEVGANMTVKQADEISDKIEKKLRAANPDLSEITIHIESASDILSRELEGGGTELKWYIEHAARRFPEIKKVHGIRVRKWGDGVHVVFRCHFDPELSMAQAHEASTKFENAIKNAYPKVVRIDVREEPA